MEIILGIPVFKTVEEAQASYPGSKLVPTEENVSCHITGLPPEWGRYRWNGEQVKLVGTFGANGCTLAVIQHKHDTFPFAVINKRHLAS